MSAAYTGRTVNEHGTPVFHAVCRACGEQFQVIPHPPPDRMHVWLEGGCTGPHCSSYDSTRDVDLMLGEGSASLEQRR